MEKYEKVFSTQPFITHSISYMPTITDAEFSAANANIVEIEDY